jgi:ribonuclease H2 subunit B
LKQVYYRPSLARIVALLQTKVDHLAEPERFEQFDHFVRALGREGMLSEETNPELLRGASDIRRTSFNARRLRSGLVLLD